MEERVRIGVIGMVSGRLIIVVVIEKEEEFEEEER